MIHWAWLIITGFGSFFFGLGLMAFLSGAKTKDGNYHIGYQHGHTDGYFDGVRSVERIG